MRMGASQETAGQGNVDGLPVLWWPRGKYAVFAGSVHSCGRDGL